MSIGLGLDLRTTWRALVRRPAYSVAVVATLGVAVAANVLVFELLTGALWRPLPFRQPDGLIRVWEVRSGHSPAGSGVAEGARLLEHARLELRPRRRHLPA